ncbi:cyclic pyranopterin monophosphate synthase MoaC [Komagataeibacter swingsii]|uniref:Cyclic pyranopterin monophosphate synthase n=1 Tax=Komagataeibacter swingsii TaxID=215220 RepID=A0A2V4RL21_9PROT|nr:cyclic pyranopterin monophosphate synthase MoaC [Komagataeibacter swingsii]PYD69365.1 cyclic pyranopterin monophosphate synthase MoaC [Komagataeibacter swingsii]GBQ64358.1 molybdopterin biosynthesis protein MoaC [Komagataeibacter swingsii DSM 16373]
MTGGRLSHLDAAGHAVMVDVSAKPDTRREAVAHGHIRMRPATLAMILSGAMPKGDVLATARIAGIMAAKKTSDLIPLCHPLAIASVRVDLAPDAAGEGIEITARVRTTGPTGVEMEALTAASVAALTLYDMCKAVERDMEIGQIHVIHKSGGASGAYDRAATS